MATSTARSRRRRGRPAVLDDKPPTIGPIVPDGGVDVGNLFQWKRTRSSWRRAANGDQGGLAGGAGSPTGIGGPGGVNAAGNTPSSGSGSGASNSPPLISPPLPRSATASPNLGAGGAAGPGAAAQAAIERPLHAIQGAGRIAKSRGRPARGAGSVSSQTPAMKSALAAIASTGNGAAAPAAESNRSSSTPADAPPGKTVSTLDLIEMDNPVLSFWGPDIVPLPSRFARIKRNLIAGHESALESAWARLTAALRAEVEHIEGLGSHLIPSVEFSDLDDAAQTARFGRDLKRYGVGVVRGVVPKKDADDAVRETVRYIQRNHDARPPPQPQDPTCFDFFWTPAQVRARAHPSVLRTQRFMMGLWGASAEDRLVTRYPVAYADRIRVHAPAAGPAGTPSAPASNGLPGPPVMPPRSADDWLSAIQSSGVIAQVDNGSLERWEPDGYQRGGTYNHVFQGNWEDYDPWEVAGRATTTTDLYNGYAACSIFRMFQGLVALSTIEPGMIRLLPSPKLVTAYFLLRPFFSPRRPPPEVKAGPEWDAYLAPENWALEREQNSYVHGAVPGHAQRVTELWHPHLQLRRSMITLPTLQSGDYIFWHPDLAYHITSDGTGLRSPNYGRPDEVSMLVYVPAAPLTQTNALYLARQRKAFQRGQPGPDFDSAGLGIESEAPQDARLKEEDIAETGGDGGLQAMGLASFEGLEAPTPDEREGRMDVDVETRSVGSSTSAHAEAEVIRLANIILFPDKAFP